MRRIGIERGSEMKRFLMIATMALAAGIAGPAEAQGLPTPLVEEVLVKTSLLTFNDANITGNYTVMYAKMGKPFRDRFSVDDLKQGFKSFAGRHIDLIAAMPIVRTSEPKIAGNGALVLHGYFDTSPSRLSYELNLAPSDGEWKLIAIDVKIRPAATSDASGTDLLARAGTDLSSSGR